MSGFPPGQDCTPSLVHHFLVGLWMLGLLLHFSCFQISKTHANPGYWLTRRAAGLRGNAISKCFEEWLCFFPPHSGTILHFHDYYTGLPLFLYFSSLIFFFCFPSFFFLPSFLLACRDSNMLMSMGWCLLILGVSLVIRDVEYLCMFLLDIWISSLGK